MKYYSLIVLLLILQNLSCTSKGKEYEVCYETVIFREIPSQVKKFVKSNYPDYKLFSPDEISLSNIPCGKWHQLRLNKSALPSCIPVDMNQDSLIDYAILLHGKDEQDSTLWKLMVLFQEDGKLVVKHEEFFIEGKPFGKSEYLYLGYFPPGECTPADTPFTGKLWIKSPGFQVYDQDSTRYTIFTNNSFISGFIQ